MNSLMVWSRWTAAIFMARTSSRGKRTCRGTGFAWAGCFLEAPRGVVAAAGLLAAEGASSSGVRAVGLAIGACLSLLFHACMFGDFHVCMKPCLDVAPEGGGFNGCRAFGRDFEGRAAVRHRSRIGHAVADKGFRHGAVMGKRR